MPDFNLKLVFEVLDRATAPMRRIGEAVGRIGRATGLDKVAQATGAVGVGLAAVGREAIRFGGLVAGGVTAAGGALFALVKRSAGAADELAKTADKLGVGIAALQRLEYHAGLSGVATGQLRDSVRFLLNAAGEAAQGIGAAGDTFARLGIQVTDNNGKLKSAEALMFEIADAIAKVEDPTLRVSIAQDLFGRSGAGMINMLKGGSAAMREAGREAEQLGIVTEEQARASEAFNDNLARLSQVLGHFVDMLAGNLLPYMNDFVVWLRAVAVEIRPDVVNALTAAFLDVGIAVRWVVSAWKAVTASIGTWLTIAAAVSPTVAGIVGRMLGFVRTFGLTRTVVSLLATALGAKLLFAIAGLFAPLAKLAWSLGVVAVRMSMLAAAGVRALVAGLVSMLPTLGGVIAATWAWTAALLANPLTWIVAAVIAAVAALAGAAYLLYQNWDAVVAWFTDMWARVQAVFDQAMVAIGAAWAGFDPLQWIVSGVNAVVEWLGAIDLAAVAGGWVAGLVNGITAGWRTLWSWAGTALTELVRIFAALDWTAIAGGWISNLAGGVAEGWRTLQSWAGTALAGLAQVFAAVDWTAIAGGWIFGLVYGVVTRWGDIVATFRAAFPGVLEALASLDLTAAGVALVAGLAAGVTAGWGNFKVWLTDAVATIATLFPIAGLSDIGSAWIDQLSTGISEGWERLRVWLAERVEELLDILPDWVREKVGLDGLRAPAPAAAISGAAIPSALAPSRTEVGGTVRVAFENAPAGMRVRDVAAEPGGVDIAVDAGYALASP